MYNRSMTSYMDMLSIDTEMVWSGTDIMVTTSIGGPFAEVKIQAHSARSGEICPLTLRRPSEPLLWYERDDGHGGLAVSGEHAEDGLLMTIVTTTRIMTRIMMTIVTRTRITVEYHDEARRALISTQLTGVIKMVLWNWRR